MSYTKIKLLISFLISISFTSFSQFKGIIKSIDLNSNNLKVVSPPQKEININSRVVLSEYKSNPKIITLNSKTLTIENPIKNDSNLFELKFYSEKKSEIKKIDLNVSVLKIEKIENKEVINDLVNNSFNFNEIPLGIQFITSEEEWKVNSPLKPCCCYPEFNEKNKHLGLLYNFKAFQKAKSYLQSKQSTSTLCTKSEWDLILKDLKKDPNTFYSHFLNCYPGYYDQTWYSPEEFQAGYWVDENTMVAFSKETFTEPMIDENIINDDESKRQSLIALTIKLKKSTSNLCNIDTWYKENVNIQGDNNQIKFITNPSEWNLYSPQKPCCCYIDFDITNEHYGLLYNFKALEVLKNDQSLARQGLRIALEKDWNTLVSCIQTNGDYNILYNCQENNYNGFNLIPNGYYEKGSWNSPDKGICTFWCIDNQNPKVIQFNCSNKEEIYKSDKLSYSEFEKRKQLSAYMVRFIKL